MSTTPLERLAAAKRDLPPPKERRRLREGAGLSIREFAHALGVSATSVARWETGERQPHGPFLHVYVDGLRTLALTQRQEAGDG
jgi:DNA-binding transcriptional regulator YiaG